MNDLDLYQVFAVGDCVWYRDNDDPTDIGKVIEILNGRSFPYMVEWADGEVLMHHPTQLALVTV